MLQTRILRFSCCIFESYLSPVKNESSKTMKISRKAAREVVYCFHWVAFFAFDYRIRIMLIRKSGSTQEHTLSIKRVERQRRLVEHFSDVYFTMNEHRSLVPSSPSSFLLVLNSPLEIHGSLFSRTVQGIFGLKSKVSWRCVLPYCEIEIA